MFSSCYFSKRNIIVFSFFFTYLILGLALYKDYGISWDEPQSRLNGEVNFKYVSKIIAPNWSQDKFNNTPDLKTWVDRDYGVAFELPLYILEKIVKPKGNQEIFFLRHLITFLYSSLGAWFLYKIVTIRLQDWRIGLLGAIFLILSPRFFAETFYNSKDIVFMVAFLSATYTLYLSIIRPKPIIAVLHGLVTAFATDIRIIGFSLILLTFIGLVTKAFSVRSYKKYIIFFLIYSLTTVGFVIVMFPWLWESPIENFLASIRNMTNFRWNLDVTYLGSVISAQKLPWHYNPVWILITTPLVFLVLFFLGLVSTIQNFLITRKYGEAFSDNTIFDLIIICIIFGPIFAGIIFKSTFYDGWRQVYFIYPAILLVAINGFQFCLSAFTNSMAIQFFLRSSLAVCLIVNAWLIAQMHPLQNLYFNALAGVDVRKKFEIDYWGLANRSALEHLLKQDPRPRISIIATSATPLGLSFDMLKPSQAERLVLVESVDLADYIVTNYRMDTSPLLEYSATHQEFYHLRVNGEIVLTIYKSQKINKQ